MPPRFALALAVASLLSVVTARAARADDADPPPDPPAEPRFTRGQVDGLAALSAVFSVGAYSVNYLPSARLFKVRDYYHYPVALAATGPLFYVSPGDAFPVAGVQLGGTGASIGLRYGKGRDSALTPYWNAMEGINLHTAFYSTYATYRDARMQGRSDAWNDSWRPWTADQLIAAPFHWKNIGRPVVYAPLLVGLTFASTQIAVAAGHHTGSRAGPAVRDTILGAATGLDAGITEEAFFRGVFFEELRQTIGRWPASIVDSLAFSALHVPGELNVLTQTQILTGLGTRAALSLVLEEAYIEGGLPVSIALHGLWDTTLFIGDAISSKNTFAGALMPVLGAPSSPRASLDRSSRAQAAASPTLFPLFSTTF